MGTKPHAWVANSDAAVVGDKGDARNDSVQWFVTSKRGSDSRIGVTGTGQVGSAAADTPPVLKRKM